MLRYVTLYNHQLPQSALKSKTLMQAMKDWYKEHSHLFQKRPYDRPGCDIYPNESFWRRTRRLQKPPSGLCQKQNTSLTSNYSGTTKVLPP